MMKKYIIVLLAAIATSSSCNNILDTKPADFLNPDNYYQTPEQLDFARRGVYSVLGDNFLYGYYTLWAMAWTADEAYMNRNGLTSGPWNYVYTASEQYSSNFWRNLYLGVNRANMVLANVDNNPGIDQALRDKIRGEVLFLRSYFYFLLVQYYGGVPLRLTPALSVNDVQIPRASVREVYDQIIADMTTAETLVPPISALGFGGAISKSAVRGLLAKVNLFMAGEPLKDQSRYAEAKKWAKLVMDDADAGHQLNPSYPDIFKRLAADLYDIKESIWEVEFWGNLSDQYVEVGNNGYINGLTSNVASATGRGDAYLSITAKLYNSYEPGDLRKWFNIPHFVYTISDVNGAKTLTNPPTSELAKYNLRPAKYRREYETLLPKSQRTPQNVSLLRYTDVLMMFAEAENAINGPTPEAVEAVNRVRRRSWSTGVKTITITSGGSGYTSAPTVTFSAGDGSTAKGTTRINSAGRVTSIVLDRDPEGVTFSIEGTYSSPPTITISGGGGSGATAEATIYSLAEADVLPQHTGSKEAFLAFIQDERMREFNLESSRKSDLIRWGIFVQVNQDMSNQIAADAPAGWYRINYNNITAKHLLMPIPSVELTANSAMTQNPGWE